ncbi:MAG: glycosyltransferase [Erysipelothrix sp.]|nr:glycosyltransferase [Erysipelothrix sp.]
MNIQNSTNDFKTFYSNKEQIQSDIIFSIIIPIYNVEDYLSETIESVINQTIDFEKHVEVILVNDGSPDNSEEICLHYQNMFPQNIFYYKKKNGGVSSARNYGLKFATGRFINFLDSDDTIDPDTLEKVLSFFSVHSDKVDIVCLPLYYFEARSGSHMLNNKFIKTGIIDINENPQFIQLHVSSTFIRRDIAWKYRFDENLKYGEDAKFVTEIILEKLCYGVIKEGRYNYRIRASENSAIQNSKYTKAWYNDSLVYLSMDLIRKSLEKFNTVIPYIQYLVMYDLQWKLRVEEIPKGVLSDEELKLFIDRYKEILTYIDDNVINNQKFISHNLKLYTHYLKYSNDQNINFTKVYYHDNIKVYYRNKLHLNLKNQRVYISTVDFKEDKLLIEGVYIGGFEDDSTSIVININNKDFVTTKVSRPLSDVVVWGQVVKKAFGFRVNIPIEDAQDVNNITFWYKENDRKFNLKYSLTHSVKFSKKVPSYYHKNGWIVYPGKRDIKFTKATFLKLFRKELGMYKRMLKLRNKKTGALKAIGVRILFQFIKKLLRKDIYLYMDRIDKADDNAEVLFKYATENDKSVNHKFILDKNSEDFKRLKGIGRVIPFGSYEHKINLLLSKKFISSHADEILLNPFKSMKLFYKDILDYDFIFLQHGITQNDLSSWLNKYHKNIKLFVTASLQETESIINERYGYSNQEVKCLGFARHDRLKSSGEKNILIMPTWRKKLATNINDKFQREYNPDFIKSEYYQRFNKLLNDEKLLETMEKHGYKIKLVLHPILTNQRKDFLTNQFVEIVDPASVSYANLFNSAMHLITDYSSVAFDFAYLRKTVSYYQFDREEFYSQHLNSGYFDYERMGFGPVIFDHDSLINYLINLIENDCKLDQIYERRINDFFLFNDNNNAMRNYNEIKKL